MSEIKQINTGVAEIIAVKVPEGASEYDVCGPDLRLWFCNNNKLMYIECIELPPGNWTPLGIDTELNEGQCREVVPSQNDYVQGFSSEIFDDWTDPDNYFDTAKEAFASLMQANGCYSKNPYKDGKPSIVNHDVWYSEEQWQQAEANTGTWIILKRLS